MVMHANRQQLLIMGITEKSKDGMRYTVKHLTDYENISIRHAVLDEKYKTFEWLCLSDTTAMHMGPPDFPDIPVPDWQQFRNDFEDFYYEKDKRTQGAVMIITKGNEEIGCLCYACFHLKPQCTELDIWMKSKAYCGKGYGSFALKMLVDYLHTNFSVANFIIRPAEKNHRAIRAYEKIGFKSVADKNTTIKKYLLADFVEQYGDGDYGLEQTAVLTLEK